MPRYLARYNVDTQAWEVFDTQENRTVESFSCGPQDELRHYAEHRALAHACRLNDLHAGRQDRDEDAAADNSAN